MGDMNNLLCDPDGFLGDVKSIGFNHQIIFMAVSSQPTVFEKMKVEIKYSTSKNDDQHQRLNLVFGFIEVGH